MTRQPTLYYWMFMGGVIVQNAAALQAHLGYIAASTWRLG
jgi:hypothetical protein